VCGIAGLIADHGTVISPGCLRQVTEAMRHRGPDDLGTQVMLRSTKGVQVGLGHCRLAVIDLSPAGHQPMHDSETGNWIVYNGEVYNFKEIKEKLERVGTHFSSQSDTEVILKAYGLWGEKCLHEFRGMFAFAIWDAKRTRLFLARDRLGIKPLYYFHKNGIFLFASEVRAILKSGWVPCGLSLTGLRSYLSFGSVYDPTTLIEGIYALNAGHYLIWEEGGLVEKEYWEVGTLPAARSVRDEGEKERVFRELREELDEAVRYRLVSDVPVGVFLSGGIDSSTLVGLVSRNGSSQVNTFSVVFKEADYSESRFSRMIAQRFKTDHHEIALTQRDALEAVPEALRAMDQPTMDGINTYVVSREVRRAGLKVALSGLGGDEVFAGYSTFDTVPKMERFLKCWNLAPAGLRKLAANAFSFLMPPRDRTHKIASLIEGGGTLSHPYLLSRSLFTPQQRVRLLKDQEDNGDEKNNQGIAEWLRRAEGLDPINRVSYLELRNYMGNTLLRDTDCMSMAHGLEVRVPLIDHRLVEFLFTLPGSLKVDGAVAKTLLIKATEGLLPDEVIKRPKRGFTLPFEYWLRDELRHEVERVLLNFSEHRLSRFLDPAGVCQVWKDFLGGRISWSRPWALYVLARWCALHLQDVRSE